MTADISEALVRLGAELPEKPSSCGKVRVSQADLRALLDAYADKNARLEAWKDNSRDWQEEAGRLERRESKWRALARARREQVRGLEISSEYWLEERRAERAYAGRLRAQLTETERQLEKHKEYLETEVKARNALFAELAAANEQVWKMEDAWGRSTKAFEATILGLEAELAETRAYLKASDEHFQAFWDDTVPGLETTLAEVKAEAARASAELRHAYKAKTDWNLVARAIEILERLDLHATI